MKVGEVGQAEEVALMMRMMLEMMVEVGGLAEPEAQLMSEALVLVEHRNLGVAGQMEEVEQEVQLT